MNEKDFESEGRFYAHCAELLGATHSYKPWIGRPPNRWNNRHPGNGRFPGFGTIKRFGPTSFHVCLRSPVAVNKMCRSEKEVFDILENILTP